MTCLPDQNGEGGEYRRSLIQQSVRLVLGLGVSLAMALSHISVVQLLHPVAVSQNVAAVCFAFP